MVVYDIFSSMLQPLTLYLFIDDITVYIGRIISQMYHILYVPSIYT